MIARSQDWRADDYQINAGFVPELGSAVMTLLDPRPGERVLDLGCGDGVLTARLAEAGCDVVGVDSAPDLLRIARERGLNVSLMDGHDLCFEAEFDSVFSNAALHWMTEPDRVADGVRRALKPGGRFVAEFGGHGNVAACRAALFAMLNARGLDGAAFSPWYFPTVAEYGGLLTRHGFMVHSAELIPRPTPLPTDIGGWMDTFGQAFFNALAPAERAAARAEVIELLRPILCDHEEKWTADYVRLRFSASLPS